MADDIDTRITPTLHPDSVTQIDGYDDDTAPVLAPTMTAFSNAYEGIRAVYAAREAANRNPAWTEEARIIQVDAFAHKHIEKITRTFDATRTNLVKGIAALEQQLSQPLESKAAASIAAEIRVHVKNLTTEKRHEFIQHALDGGDHITVSAVLGAPPYLSGLDGQFQQVYTRRWHERTSPDATKRLRAMQGAKAMIEERAGLVFTAMEKAVGGTSAKARNLREAQTAAERAFVLKDA